MKNNFDISIPSIPSRAIKFKIQDIKSTAFGSQKNRFLQNKSFLTQKFIESFGNFREKPLTMETEAQSRMESRDSERKEGKEQDYRLFIPEEKKHMLHHLDKYKDYKVPILKETKYNRGYSFYKTDTVLPAASQKPYNTATAVSDNFYFPPQRERPAKGHRSVSMAPSCVFKNETRQRVYLKQDALLNRLGPGHYDSERERKEKQEVKKKPQKNLPQEIDYKKLTNIITNIVGGEQSLPEEEVKDKEVKPDFMFIQDDRDRFGQQKYPIVDRTGVPGPGAYDIKQSIETVAQKVIVVEEQRKLLKEWFNN